MSPYTSKFLITPIKSQVFSAPLFPSSVCTLTSQHHQCLLLAWFHCISDISLTFNKLNLVWIVNCLLRWFCLLFSGSYRLTVFCICCKQELPIFEACYQSRALLAVNCKWSSHCFYIDVGFLIKSSFCLTLYLQLCHQRYVICVWSIIAIMIAPVLYPNGDGWP